MKENNTNSLEDIFLWSDDFEVISVYSKEYDAFFEKELGNE
jgi:hypothetical protein